MYGGSKQDQPTSIEQTSDGGYIVLGFTYSDDGDVPGNHSHRRDYWALRLDANGNIIWSKNYGGSHHEVSGNIIEANDGDRKSTRLNSSHVAISYAVFCLKKKIDVYC